MSLSNLPTLASLNSAVANASIAFNSANTTLQKAQDTYNNAQSTDPNFPDLNLNFIGAQTDFTNAQANLNNANRVLDAYNTAVSAAQTAGYSNYPNLLALAGGTAAQSILKGGDDTGAATDSQTALQNIISANNQNPSAANDSLNSKQQPSIAPSIGPSIGPNLSGPASRRPSFTSNVNYLNYIINITLTADDFGLPIGSDLTSTIDYINQKFPIIASGSYIDNTLTIPTDVKIPSGLNGWVNLFIIKLINAFQISFGRIYDVNVNQNQTAAGLPSQTSVLGVGITSSDETSILSSINISFKINNMPSDPSMPNDFLPAVNIGNWIVTYLKGDLKNDISYSDIYPSAPLPGIPYNNPYIKKELLGSPDMTSYLPPIIGKFTSQISNVFKKRSNKKLTEYFDNSLVSGSSFVETNSSYISPMLTALSGYKPRTSQTKPESWENFTINFTLTKDDFTPNNDLNTIWTRMSRYVSNYIFTLYGTPGVLYSPTGIVSGPSGFIQEFLSVYAEILQISMNRFDSIIVKPNNVDLTKNPLPDTIDSFYISFNVNNNIAPPYQPNDFLDAITIGTWLNAYWGTFTTQDTNSLPPFLPVPVQTMPPANEIPVGTLYKIQPDPPLPGPTPIPLLQVTMVNPVSHFIGGIDNNLNIVKLTSRIKNLSSPATEHFSSNKKLLEHITTSTSPTSPPVAPTLSTSTPSSSTSYSILDYIFQFSYITCFVGAVLLSISQLIGWDIIAFTLNDSFVNYVYIYIGICSIIALFSWFNTSIWYIDPKIINPANVAISNTSILF